MALHFVFKWHSYFACAKFPLQYQQIKLFADHKTAWAYLKYKMKSDTIVVWQLTKSTLKKTVEFSKYLRKKYPYQDQYEWDYTIYQARKV